MGNRNASLRLALAATLAVAADLLSVCGAAHAQATAEPPQEDVAKALFEAGKTAFDAGQYEEALDSWLRAYRYSERPQLLYNLGLAADRLRRDEDALGYYERYLRELPDAENRVEARNRIAALRRARTERERAAGANLRPAAGPPPTSDLDRSLTTEHRDVASDDGSVFGKWWFWVATGGVVAAVVVGAVVLGDGGSATVGDARPGTQGIVVVALSTP